MWSRRLPGASALAALAVAVVAVSTSAILIRWSRAPPQVAAFYRVAVTVALLAPVTLVRQPAFVRRFSRRDGVLAALAGIALSVHFATWFESLSWTSVAASVTLVQAQPVFVALGAWAILDERVNRQMTIGIAVAVAGATLLSVSDAVTDGAATGPWPLWGNLLALAGGAAGAAYLLVGRSLRQRLPVLPYVTVVYATCTVCLLGIASVGGHALGGYPQREWLLFLGMAVGPGILGHTVLNWVLEEVESTVVGVALLGEPVGSTLLAAVLLGEVPGVIPALGVTITLAGIVLTVRDAPTRS